MSKCCVTFFDLWQKKPSKYLYIFDYQNKQQYNSAFWTHLPRVSDSDQGTDGVKGSCSTDQQMGLVVMLQDLDVVCTLRLLEDIQEIKHLVEGEVGRGW